MEELIANSHKQSLIAHSRAVSDVGVYLGNYLGLDSELIESIRLGGLLHDIGKATKSFQSYITGISNKSVKCNFALHHEISWAILCGYGFTDEYSLNAIYWHHAKPLDEKYNCRETVDEIIDLISDEDIECIKSLCTILGLPLSSDYSNGNIHIPTLYQKLTRLTYSKNSKLLTVRACVIAADRYISSLDSLDDYLSGSMLIDYIGDIGILDYSIPIGYDSVRFNTQVKCVQSAVLHKTSQVNAPAGFGKTLQGVLYSLSRGKRVFWVVPRNVIAESLYPNILRELSVLGVSRSVELFLGGERKVCTDSNIAECLSDIVITNIDNLVNPMVSNLVADRLYLSLSSDVIFDEFHEFVSDSPMFAAFIHLMRSRHSICSNSHTLLLSATPMNIHSLWDLGDLETVEFPCKGTHYPAAHSGLYNLNLVTGDNIPNPVNGGVSITNSIRNAQRIKLNGDADILVHSGYTDSDRSIIMDRVLNNFDKSGIGILSGLRVSSAPVLQAALDISFSGLSESVLSAEASLQRIGRVNRWGEQDCIPIVNIWDAPDSNKAERSAISTMFNERLKSLWVTHLRSNLGDSCISLNDLYSIYSSFYVEYGKEVKEFLKDCLEIGTSKLVDYGPVKLPDTPKNKKDSGGRSLRNPSGSFYYIVKDTDGNWLPEGNEFSFSYIDLHDVISRSDQTLNDWKKLLKSLVNCGYIGFSRKYENIRKGRTEKNPNSNADKWTKDRSTPYPRIDKIYHRDENGNIGLGLIKS